MASPDGSKPCPNLDYPLDVAGAVGGMIHEKVLICGGWNENRCYVLEKEC